MLEFKTLAGIKFNTKELCIFKIRVNETAEKKYTFSMDAEIGKFDQSKHDFIDTSGYSQAIDDYIGYFTTLDTWHDWLYLVWKQYNNKELPLISYLALKELYNIYYNGDLKADILYYLQQEQE